MAEDETTVSMASEREKILDYVPAQSNGHDSQEDEVNANGRENVEEDNSIITQDQPQPSESKNTTIQTNLVVYEKRIEALQQQLRVRDVTMMELADENENLTKVLTELKSVLKESVTERECLVDKIKQQQKVVQSAQASVRKAEGEVAELKREVNEVMRDASDARREATDASVALADAKAEVWAIREAAKGKALGEDERRELEGALKALSASSQRAAQEAGSWKEKAQIWRGKAEVLNDELENKAKAHASLENELALTQQHVKDAEAQAQDAKHSQEAAENALEQLRQESDRRARTFNTAVKSSVGKIQSDLERERDSALQCIEALQLEVEGQTNTLKESNEALTRALDELAAAKMRISQLEEESQQTNIRLAKLQEEVELRKSNAEAANKKTEAALGVVEGLTNKVVKLENRCEELTAASDSAIRNAAILEASLVSDICRLKSALVTSQNEKQLLQITSSEKILKVSSEQTALRAKLSDLEGQTRVLQAQASGQGSGTGPKYRQGSALDSLGLEGVREERLQWKDKPREEDVEKSGERRTGKSINQLSLFVNNMFPSSWTWLQDPNQDNHLPRGHVSRRSLLVLLYIGVLHIIVMVSFTHRSQSCVEMVGEELAGKLPGR